MVRRAYPKVRARLLDELTIRAVGREAETLLMLVQKGSQAVRAYDFAGGPPVRLGAYVHDLRRMVSAFVRTESLIREGAWRFHPVEPCDRQILHADGTGDAE